MATVMDNNEILAEAFAAFNAHSERLDDAYMRLTERVQRLTGALAEAKAQRQDELLEKEQLAARMAELIEALPALVLVTDSAGTVVDANEGALAAFGADIHGKVWSDICAARLSTDGAEENEVCLDGSTWLHCSQRRLPSGGHLVQLTNVSVERRRREVRERDNRLAMLGEVSARLAHQIRTPLATAMLYATQPDDDATCKAPLLARLQEMSTMVDDLLCFARGEPDGEQWINTGDLVAEARSSCDAGIADAENIIIRSDVRGYAVLGNRIALVGALSNLLMNACQHSDGTITIADHIDPSGRVCLSVTDEGPGISDDIAARIFEPFFTTRSNGTGLGLAVVRSVARSHGGDVA